MSYIQAWARFLSSCLLFSDFPKCSTRLVAHSSTIHTELSGRPAEDSLQAHPPAQTSPFCRTRKLHGLWMEWWRWSRSHAQKHAENNQSRKGFNLSLQKLLWLWVYRDRWGGENLKYVSIQIFRFTFLKLPRPCPHESRFTKKLLLFGTFFK